MAEHQSSNILVMYSQEFCPTCVKARRTLTEEGVDFEERWIDDRVDWQDLVLAKTKQVTVPVFVQPDGAWEVGFRGERG